MKGNKTATKRCHRVGTGFWGMMFSCLKSSYLKYLQIDVNGGNLRVKGNLHRCYRIQHDNIYDVLCFFCLLLKCFIRVLCLLFICSIIYVYYYVFGCCCVLFQCGVDTGDATYAYICMFKAFSTCFDVGSRCK